MKRLMLLAFLTVPLLLHAADALVARINGAAITSRDLDEAVDKLIPRMSFHGSVSADRRAELRQQAFEELIDSELKYQDVQASGMKPDKKMVKQQMGIIRDRFKSKKEYEQALAEAGTTEDGLRMMVEKEVLVSQVVSAKVTEPSRMTEAAVKEYYEKNTDKFVQPEGVKLRIISSKIEKNANEALARVKAGEDFGNVAARLSEDNFRIKGGDIGYVHRGRILPELETAAFSMKKGEVSGLIKAEGMLFILKVEDKRPSYKMTYEEVNQKLKKELETKKASELKEAWMNELRNKAKIEIIDQTLKVSEKDK
jgi:parvulin-like peptidyl-prolyl isomerase